MTGSHDRQSVMALYQLTAGPKPYQRSRLSGVGPSLLAAFPGAEIRAFPSSQDAVAAVSLSPTPTPPPQALNPAPAAALASPGHGPPAAGPPAAAGMPTAAQLADAADSTYGLRPPVPATPLATTTTTGSSGGLREAQRVALSTVDLDVLHSFGFDALLLPKQHLVAFVVSMFVELELAYFT